MPESDLVICHAGHGTLARALVAGVPVLAVPHAGDMAENAARADWAGLGVRLPWGLRSPQTLRLAVRRALGMPSLRAAATGIAARYDERTGPRRAADLLEALARRMRAGSA